MQRHCTNTKGGATCRPRRYVVDPQRALYGAGGVAGAGSAGGAGGGVGAGSAGAIGAGSDAGVGADVSVAAGGVTAASLVV
jgi:hypothetical protein